MLPAYVLELSGFRETRVQERVVVDVLPGEDSGSGFFEVERGAPETRVRLRGVPGATVEADAVLALSCKVAARLDLVVRRVASDAPAVRLTLREDTRLVGDALGLTRGARIVTEIVSRWPLQLGLSLTLPANDARKETLLGFRSPR